MSESSYGDIVFPTVTSRAQFRLPDGSLRELAEYPLILERASPYPVIDLSGRIPDGARPIAMFDRELEIWRLYAVPVDHVMVDRVTGQIVHETPPPELEST